MRAQLATILSTLLFSAACAMPVPSLPIVESTPDVAPTIRAFAGVAIPKPDRLKTPGAVLAVSAADICVPGYASKVRDVSAATKELIYQSYGVSDRDPGEYQIDHLISLQLGGSNDVANLWPIRDEGPGGKAQKDVLENRLHTLVCSGKLDLKAAQVEISSDWYASYLARIGVTTAP